MKPTSCLPKYLFFGVVLFMNACTQPAEKSTPEAPEEDVVLNTGDQSEIVEIYYTARDTALRLTQTGTLQFEAEAQPNEFDASIMLDPSKTAHTFMGIGGALTDAAAETFYKLPEQQQERLLKAYFSPTEGIGYTVGRTHINSCDFSSSSYAYTEIEGDTALEHFDIEPDRQYRIPFIKAALAVAGEDFKILASPWSPPAWMKTNYNMLQGGKLKPEYYQAWADYFVRFIEEYEKEGVIIDGVTVQNEPMATQTWESCIYTAEEERDFVKNYLGPTFHSNGMKDKKIVIWDHNRGIMYQRAKVVLDDEVANKYVWGTGFHWYVGDHFENVRYVKEAFPDKELLFTEGCVFPFNRDSLYEWHWGERYGESLIHDLNNGAVAWVDWNILLDETGGPNHVQNFCFAPVIADTQTGELIFMNSYYYLGHFSKFIKRGAKRIIASSNDDRILTTAFLNPSGQVVVVVMNQTDENINLDLWLDGKVVNLESRKHSIFTALI